MVADSTLRKKDSPVSSKSKRSKADSPFDAGAIPAAPLVGFANRWAMVRSGDLLELCLWEETQAGATVATVRFYITILDVFVSMWPAFAPLLQEFRASSDIGDLKGEAMSSQITRSAGVSVLVNVLMIARSGQSAVLDCHYLSPRVLHTQTVSNRALLQADVTPICSVQITTRMLLGIFEHMQALMPALSDEAKTWLIPVK
jgi:hypothetical protein